MQGYTGIKKTKTKLQTNLKIQFEEINQKILTKKERLKKYQDRVKQYKQNRTFQNTKRKSY